MWDRITNAITTFIRDLSNTTFTIIMAITIVASFYFVALFLKANKKEAPKVSKVSYILIAIFLLAMFVVLGAIR